MKSVPFRNTKFLAIAGGLLVGIVAASLFTLLGSPQRTNLKVRLAHQLGMKDEAEYIHYEHLQNADLDGQDSESNLEKIRSFLNTPGHDEAKALLIVAPCSFGWKPVTRERIFDILLPHCSDANSAVRYALAMNIGGFPSPRARTALIGLTKDPSEEVRNVAKQRLDELSSHTDEHAQGWKSK